MASGLVQENTVVYKLYPLFADDLPKLRGDILNSISDTVAPYIWQKEPFSLNIINGCLFGEVDFDQNIEDEWFIVYLLFEISKSFPTLIIEVQDDDGQFLLIEAADHLPKWMEPEVCSNRVFIFRGNLHAISPKMLHEIESPIEGGKFVAKHEEQTIVSSAMMQCIKKRMGDYPSQIQHNQHSVNCFIPANLAAILSERPDLISLGITAFCDSVMSSASRPKIMSYFRPVNRVLYRVTMTRCQYSQLMFHRFVPDRKEGWASADLISSVGPKALDLGIKLAYGFEYACKRAQSLPTANRLPGMDPNVFTSAAFNRFLSSLVQNGYFRGNLEGSREYQRLLIQARNFYADSLSSAVNVGTDYLAQSGGLLLHLFQNIKVDIQKMKLEGSSLPPDDVDSWLYDFECSVTSIGERAGLNNGSKASENGHGKAKGNGNGNGNVPLDHLVSKMSKFVNAMSSAVDGVEIGDADGDCRHVDSSDSDSSENGDEKPAGKKEAPYLDDFLYDSDEYSNGHGDSSLDEDYSSDKQMKMLMKQMDAELRQPKNGAIGKDEVRMKPAGKVLAHNLHRSCQAEGGRPGPASVILKQLRVKMPAMHQRDSDDDSD